MSLPVRAVAQFFLSTNPKNSITQLKLQNLCVYAQAFVYAFLKVPLFPEKCILVENEPVIFELHNIFQEYSPSQEVDLSSFTLEQRLILAGINVWYAEKFSTWELQDKFRHDFSSSSEGTISSAILQAAVKESPLYTVLHTYFSSDAKCTLDLISTDKTQNCSMMCCARKSNETTNI